MKPDRKNEAEVKLISLRGYRIMALRYLIPVIFFMNVYWALMESYHFNFFSLLPLINLIALAFCFYEQFRFMHRDDYILKIHHYVLIVTLFTSLGALLSHNLTLYLTKVLIIISVGIGVLIKLYLLYKVKVINNHQDKNYPAYLKQLKLIKKGI